MIKIHSIPRFDDTELCRTVFTEKDPRSLPSLSDVSENDILGFYSELCNALSVKLNNVIRIKQIHSSIILTCDSESKELGSVLPSCRTNADGIITNTAGLLLCTVEADCVPVYILDTKNRAIGMIHSGWRGTLEQISVKALEQMHQKYGTVPHETLFAFGPCICGNCYEVGEELYVSFSQIFGSNACDRFFLPKTNGKFLLDVAGCITHSLIEAGVPADNIIPSPACTYHEQKLKLDSYRRDGKSVGRMVTAITLL